MRGGKRKNAGRKPIWNNSDTCTIRVPRIYARKLMQLARRWDSGEDVDIDTKSNQVNEALDNEFVTESNDRELQQVTKSNIISKQPHSLTHSHFTIDSLEKQENHFDKMTKSLSLLEVVKIAKTILRHKKSARISITKLISKLYSIYLSPEDFR